MSDPTTTITALRDFHRQRRYAMKLQQKIDRATESFLRVNATAWDPNADEGTREKANREVKDIIKHVHDGEPHAFAHIVKTGDEARAPADKLREDNERAMEAAAKTLPVYPWIEGVRGAGALGLATIVAEAKDLSIYPTPAHLWSRLGFAPFDGHAGSTWKRPTWRPRTLSAEEWTEHPFSGERYALMFQIATWLVNSQWVAAGKSDTGEGKPNGVYGEVYAKRRADTAKSHPDWSKQHARMDALRVAMKAFLKDLWKEWNRLHGTNTVIDEKPQPKRTRRRVKEAA